jgi:hypothetical protein
MRPLVSGLLAFSLLVVAHIVVWRVRRPAQQYTKLAILSLAVLTASVGSFYVIQTLSADSIGFLPIAPFDYFNLSILYAAFFLSYLTTYSAVQADSPTMAMLLRIEEAGDEGLTLDELLAQLDDAVLVLPRIEDLVAGDLVRLHGGQYVIRSSGAFLASVHLFYRGLLNMEKGG